MALLHATMAVHLASAVLQGPCHGFDMVHEPFLCRSCKASQGPGGAAD